MTGFLFRLAAGASPIRKTLSKHFKGTDLPGLVTAGREFPITSRVDVQVAIEQ
ncbi:MAG: hypothetical protein JO061_02045, partial [Acidobacteriaceae bacterium]|nr:hypothetical protein [Acidobacteriaceae bacterium]